MNERNRLDSRLLTGLISIGLGLCVSGCSPDLNEIRAQGIGQFRQKQYVESMATLRYVLSMDPSDPQANYYMGLNYRARAAGKFREDDVPAACRELDTSIKYFTQAIKTWPNYMEAITCKNEALEARGKYEKALEMAQQVARNNRGVAEHYIFLGNEYRERGDYDNALRSYKMALASDRESSEAYAAMGKLYLRINDRAKALDALRKAYELNPSNTEVSDQLARLEMSSGTREAVHQPSDY